MRPEFFIFASVFSWGLGTFLFKGSTNNGLHPIMISTIALCTYAIIIPSLWTFVKFDHSISVSGIIYTIAGALFMCIGNLGFSYILRNGGAVGQMSVVTSTYPAVTLILSMIFLGETLSIRKLIGIVLALVSVSLLSIK